MSLDLILKGRRNALPTHLEALRQEAEKELLLQGIPSRKNEDWRYAPLSAFRETKYGTPSPGEKISVQELETSILITIPLGAVEITNENSQILLALGLEVRTLRAGEEELFVLREKSFSPQLNQALSGAVILLKVLKGRTVAKPIEVIYTSEDRLDYLFATSRLVVQLEEGASLCLSENINLTTKGFVHLALRADVGNGARLKLLQQFKSTLDGQVVHYLDGKVERDASLQDWSLSLGGGLHRFEGRIKLVQTGSSVDSKSLALLSGKEVADYQICCDHMAGYSTSRQTFKCVLSDQSRGIFNGRVEIKKGCQQSDSKQMNKTLLLSDKAEIDTKPQLEVWNDDVKAGHGAAVGRLNKEELFYLQSRAIEPKAAAAMLLRAFLDDILLSIPNEFQTDVRADEFIEKIQLMKAEEAVNVLSH
jgi:Fe-S cluster assembly protein SufD